MLVEPHGCAWVEQAQSKPTARHTVIKHQLTSAGHQFPDTYGVTLLKASAHLAVPVYQCEEKSRQAKQHDNDGPRNVHGQSEFGRHDCW